MVQNLLTLELSVAALTGPSDKKMRQFAFDLVEMMENHAPTARYVIKKGESRFLEVYISTLDISDFERLDKLFRGGSVIDANFWRVPQNGPQDEDKRREFTQLRKLFQQMRESEQQQKYKDDVRAATIKLCEYLDATALSGRRITNNAFLKRVTAYLYVVIDSGIFTDDILNSVWKVSMMEDQEGNILRPEEETTLTLETLYPEVEQLFLTYHRAETVQV